MKPILEQIPLGKYQSITAFHYKKENFETPWHFHPQHELTYIEESVGTKFIGDYVGAYEAGELVLVRSNLPHCWKNHSSSDRLAKSTVIQWNNHIFHEVPELDSVFEMLRNASKGIIFSHTGPELPIDLVKQLPEFDGAELYIQLLTVLVKLAKCPYTTLSKAAFKAHVSMKLNSRMAKIHEFVNENFSRKIYLKELADLVNMTEPSFSRYFSKTMGRSFFTFLNEYRINRASLMLIDTDMSIMEICYSCGYESLPFFYKQFNKLKSIPPSKYRKRYSQ